MESGSSLTRVRRSWLERVLDVVRLLGASSDLHETLNRIVEGVVDVLEFDAAAINVMNAEGDALRVAATAGPPELNQLRGQATPVDYFVELLEASEPWGALRFFSHAVDQTPVDRVARWTPPGSPADNEPGAWQPGDELMAPLYDRGGAFIGVLSVDQPRSGRLPDVEQCTVLELFAAQAATAIADATARLESETRRREAERRWQLAFEHSPVGTAIIDQDGQLVQFNDALREMLGYTRSELNQRTFANITHPDDVDVDLQLFAELLEGHRDSYEIEKRYLHRDGHIVWGLLHVGIIRADDGTMQSVVGQVNDISARKLAETQIAHRATHDSLTDLPNRLRLEEVLEACISSSRPAGALCCGIDRFKTVNDSLGHEAGDELIRAVATRLRDALPSGITIGRVGGDEFVVVVPDESDPGVLRGIAARLVAALREPIRLRGYQHTTSISVGVTVSSPRHAHADEVLRDADQALRRAKRQGRARVEFYDPTQDRPATVADLELEYALRKSLDDGTGLVPFFQPIVSLDTNAPVGYEALIRWHHPEKGMLEPDDFLPMAEQTGLIAPLGWKMLELCCQAAADPRLTGGWSRWVAVNASGSQLGRGQLAQAVRSALDAADLPPDRLHIEITETALVEASPAAIKEVREVADLGVRIALDDFGTGYSSLSLLRDLPVGTVKIDRSFVKPITSDRNARAIVRSVIALCREMGVATVGEGVETDDQITSLRALGATLAQGYLLGRPAPLPR
ncbi:MAG TPA: EAL domain-containing protein [Jatrophihabitantaceae bacterium]|jgi:diguanylate cyclase (GGDEF)-like protein/PAS domain S-box-containing protein